MANIMLPPLIKYKLYPNVFFNSSSDNVDNDNPLSTYPFPYRNYPMPSELTLYTNPNNYYPQRYEYRYTNNNGIDISIRGSYDDIMSTVNVLRTYPPEKNVSDERQMFDLTHTPQSSSSNVPEVGVKYDGKHALISMDQKVYSGSGIVIMVVEKGRELQEAKFVLFRGVKDNLYQEPGGKIDKPPGNTKIGKEILFENAKKETLEETINLFQVNSESKIFIDLESADTNTYYRVFGYLCVMGKDDISRLSSMYDNNIKQLSSLSGLFDESYRETNKVDLFDYQTFRDKLSNYNLGVSNISSGIFQKIDGTFGKVRGRTINVINKLILDKKINEIFVAKNTYTPIINNANQSNPFYQIIV
jgi:hypothetical protein